MKSELTRRSCNRVHASSLRLLTSRIAAVLAVQRLHREVVGEVAGIGQRPVVTAVLGERRVVQLSPLAPADVEIESIVVSLSSIGERQQFQQVLVGDLPVELGAPEPVVVAVLEVLVPPSLVLWILLSRAWYMPKKNRRSLIGRTRRIRLRLVRSYRRTARRCPGCLSCRPHPVRLVHQFGAGVEFVGARLGDRVDHAARGAAEFRPSNHRS